MKDWMKSHHGEQIQTHQKDKRTGKVWYPGPRVVDASRATYVKLGESRRDYKGMKVIEKGPYLLMVEDKDHVIAYHIV